MNETPNQKGDDDDGVAWARVVVVASLETRSTTDRNWTLIACVPRISV
jgi:hypothetical protein